LYVREMVQRSKLARETAEKEVRREARRKALREAFTFPNILGWSLLFTGTGGGALLSREYPTLGGILMICSTVSAGYILSSKQ
jgi:hypothetical protein